jgi:uncharacterized membrane protein
MEHLSILSSAALGTIVLFAVLGVIPYVLGALIHRLGNKNKRAKVVVL